MEFELVDHSQELLFFLESVREILVVENKFPGQVLSFVAEPSYSIKLDSKRNTPLKRFLVWSLKPHFVVGFQFIRRAKLIESLFNFVQDKEEIVDPRGHYVQASGMLQMTNIVQI